MNKNLLLAAIVGILYIGASVWLVRSEGEAFRRALRRDRVARQGPPETAKSKGAVPTSAPPTTAEHGAPAQPPAPAPSLAAATRASGPFGPGSANPEGRPVGAGDRGTENGPAPPPLLALHTPESAPAPGTRGTAAPLIARPLIDPEVFDLGHLTQAESERLGRELHELIVSRHRSMDTSDRRRVSEVARTLQQKGVPRIPPYRFTILDSDDVFAFSHPENDIYLSSALFALVSGDDELRFVLAHEMAHLELKHALKRVEAEGAHPGVGTLHQLYHGIARGYSDEQEFEADAWAARRLVVLGHTRRECLAFLRRFQGYSQEHDFGEGHKAPRSDLEAPLQDVENHFAAHPPVWERLERLQEILSAPGVSPPAPDASPTGTGSRPSAR